MGFPPFSRPFPLHATTITTQPSPISKFSPPGLVQLSLDAPHACTALRRDAVRFVVNPVELWDRETPAG
jgi:hypothetical protein